MYKTASLVKANHDKHPKYLFGKAINRKKCVVSVMEYYIAFNLYLWQIKLTFFFIKWNITLKGYVHYEGSKC